MYHDCGLAMPKGCTAASHIPRCAPIFAPLMLLPNNREGGGGCLILVASQQHHTNLPKYPAQIPVAVLQPTVDYP